MAEQTERRRERRREERKRSASEEKFIWTLLDLSLKAGIIRMQLPLFLMSQGLKKQEKGMNESSQQTGQEEETGRDERKNKKQRIGRGNRSTTTLTRRGKKDSDNKGLTDERESS